MNGRPREGTVFAILQVSGLIEGETVEYATPSTAPKQDKGKDVPKAKAEPSKAPEPADEGEVGAGRLLPSKPEIIEYVRKYRAPCRWTRTG